MTTPMKYVLTQDSAVVVDVDGKTTTVLRGAVNFQALRAALLDEDWEAAKTHLFAKDSIATWTQGAEVPAELGNRVVAMASKQESVTPLLRFRERLALNPNPRSVEQLYGFLQHIGIPLVSDGTFLAYKGVTADYKDVYTKSFDNRPGSVHTMPRGEVSDDADVACHAGFHVGALSYATWFLEHEAVAGGHVVICRVAPEDVVCVPKDHSMKKVRVWRYEVVGEWSSEAMPSTVIDEEDMPSCEDDEDEDEAGVADPTFEGTGFADRCVPTPPPPTPRPVPRRYRKYLMMSSQQLLQLSLDELRDLATHGLAVVGASKLPGGKVALVSKIVEVRESRAAS